MMETFFNSFLLVFSGEMGDKTQLLSLVLASKYRKPWTILSGVFVATLLNHGLASWVGLWISLLVSPEVLRWTLGLTFFVFAVWILVPDKESEFQESGGLSVFLTTVVVFFLAEMGDKTQLATIALGAKYASTLTVIIGTTLGMMAANALAIFLGPRLLLKIPMKWVRMFSAILFLAFGALVLIGL
jgi:putative Ca2+/H+ antiporter (TMEM165/GDT1 family)